ncbi:MAG: stomatin-like protein [Sodalinema sp.]|uniref:SPFH domain-containing protein n=1 Tax=Sodalinema sp. TaxID=3080550 RepID=UPI00120D34D7|nr:MAG: paraslipin [Phormidium sp. SL48-SHIP]
MNSIFAVIVLSAIGYVAVGIRIINQGNLALVERLGKYNRTLAAGLSFVAPVVESIVWEDTTREQFCRVDPQLVITKDNVSLEVSAVIYWRIFNLEMAYYEIEDVAAALQSRVTTIIGAEIGQRELDRTVTARAEINQVLLEQIEDETQEWGIKVLRVDIQKINPSATVLESMEMEQAAEIKKRASILEAEGTAEYMKNIARALESRENAREILHFFITQRYVDSSFKLSQSDNSKVVFMDPKALSEALGPILGDDLPPSGPTNGSREP